MKIENTVKPKLLFAQKMIEGGLLAVYVFEYKGDKKGQPISDLPSLKKIARNYYNSLATD